MLDKILGKKKTGYYLELPEDEIAALPAPSATTAAANTPAAQPVVAAPVAAAIATPVIPVPVANTVSKAADSMEQVAATAEPMVNTVELIRAAIAAPITAPTGETSVAPEPTFATDYLMTPSGAGRRNPGPSMSQFKDMAKGMRKRTTGF